MNEIKVTNDWAQYPMTLRPKHVEENNEDEPQKDLRVSDREIYISKLVFF
ncbi:hypothetical protein J2W97_000642 [Paenibacillus jamilae]|jgi:hypothetical protein|nr:MULTISPECIES: hypothetical protein [Paenibacillus]MDP9674659.1 hypothetical protein [Paenibacillus jamilae]KAF6620065.1 hypothetical protein HFE00_03145 [Paenibacillus sp. EKM101P]KAF6623057.1 hypothetical protein HFE03_05240 [Paenibacillus sp. EKM102P]KAF6634387.1 hypothetical protein HFE01_09290 [Paenibacillus sp. EKM10P]KAF6649907.1 hypothetical protein HFE02_04230 [Paenibacillus sp. EKM11P]